MQRENRLKRILDQGHVALGTCIDSCSPAVVEVAGFSGLDFVRIDTEYSWRRDDTVEHMIRAAEVAHVTPIVRVAKGDPYLVSQALQIGAKGVFVSDIASYSEAMDVVKAAKFAPRGTRGYNSFSYAADWNTRGGEDWVRWSDREILVGIMIENEQIMGQIEEVMAIDELDFCYFGPADYSMSIGLGRPQKDHPKVADAVKRTLEVAAKHDKPVAFVTAPPLQEDAAKYIAMGCRMIELGHDLGVLNFLWKNVAETLRAQKT